MARGGWEINLTGEEIPVYDGNGDFMSKGKQIGKLTPNECFADGRTTYGWEGYGSPVYFLDASKVLTYGIIDEVPGTGLLADFANYASNGTSWEQVDTLERKVQYATAAYYADGSKCCDLPAGSYVWVTQNCTHGHYFPNYIAVTKVQTKAGKTYEFDGNGFIDLTYGGRWLNVGSILLRKA